MELLIFGILVTGFIFTVGFYLRARATPAPGKRLFSQETVGLTVKEPRKKLIATHLAKKIQDLLGFAKDPLEAKELKKKLVMAGCYSERAMANFVVCKIASPIIAVAIGVPLIWKIKVGFAIKPVLLYLPVALGYYLPNLVLNHMIDKRQKKINEGLPDALDLLVVCVEAGLGLNAAMKRVSDDFKFRNAVLSMEFTMLNLEILAGLDREQALRNLSERTGVEELSTLCAILIQAERFGTSIAQALRVQSDTMRTNRRQKLEELAAKTPVKLVFPLILFIFPAVVVVILGPAIIQVMEAMGKK
jgi:tight adherence protein C